MKKMRAWSIKSCRTQRIYVQCSVETKRCRQRTHDLVDTSQRFKCTWFVTTMRFASSSVEYVHRDNVSRLHDGHHDMRTSKINQSDIYSILSSTTISVIDENEEADMYFTNSA